MIQTLIILGTGGNALDILDVVDAINTRAPAWSVAGFLDDIRPEGSEFFGAPILGRLEEASRLERHRFVNAIGSDRSFRDREALIVGAGVDAGRFATLVHPSSSVSARARLGRGVVVNFGCSIGGRAVVGDHATLGVGCIVAHDAEIGDYAVVAPGAVVSGGVSVGPGCYLGTRSVLRQSVRVGERALVGMGAVVLRDVEERDTVIGNPARSMKSR